MPYPKKLELMQGFSTCWTNEKPGVITLLMKAAMPARKKVRQTNHFRQVELALSAADARALVNHLNGHLAKYVTRGE